MIEPFDAKSASYHSTPRNHSRIRQSFHTKFGEHWGMRRTRRKGLRISILQAGVIEYEEPERDPGIPIGKEFRERP